MIIIIAFLFRLVMVRSKNWAVKETGKRNVVFPLPILSPCLKNVRDCQFNLEPKSLRIDTPYPSKFSSDLQNFLTISHFPLTQYVCPYIGAVLMANFWSLAIKLAPRGKLNGAENLGLQFVNAWNKQKQKEMVGTVKYESSVRILTAFF